LDGERGLTLLEVVIALLLFAMMAMFLLSGQARAADAILRARIEREMAELLRLRLDLAALEYEEYREGTTEGDFPSDVSSRVLDESEVLGDRFEGYRWEVTISETIGAGASSTVELDGGDTHDLLFAEEGTSVEDGDEEATSVQAEEVDRMVFILVTVYPPRYDELTEEERADAGMQARSAWTAVHRPPDESEGP
jgi:prepilin-type N-terminal cleavage/methylation domain-containing protein